MTFSVVIAAYRAGGTVARAVDSALTQTHPAHEVVVVDDCSPDDQLEVLATYGDRIRVVHRVTNGGEAAAKNAGVLASSGDWIVTLDADDAWEPGRLAAIAAYAALHPEVDIVTTDAWVEQGGRVLRRCYGGPTGARWAEGDQRAEILTRNFIFSHAAVRREVWLAAGGMDESRRDSGADWPLWVRLILSGVRAGLVEEPLVRYALHPGSLSDSAVATQRTAEAAMRAAMTHPDATPHERETASRHLADAERQLRRIEALRSVWHGHPRRRALVRIAADGGYRKRHRLEALVAAVNPGLARRRMDASPDQLGRD
jgi:succinoglycan biosynthesis protein ExoO